MILKQFRSYRRSRRAERARREERAASPPGDGRRRFVLFLFAAVAVVMVSGAIERQILDVDFLQKDCRKRERGATSPASTSQCTVAR